MKADISLNEHLKNSKDFEALKHKAEMTERNVTTLSQGEYHKHMTIKEKLSKVILATSGALDSKQISLDVVTVKQIRIAQQVIARYGIARTIRAWNDLYLFLIARPNQTASFKINTISGDQGVNIPLEYRSMRDYFFNSFPNRCMKVIFGAEADEYEKNKDALLKKILDDEFKKDEEKEDKLCSDCGHSLRDNNHGPDQNDYGMDDFGKIKYLGSCTYCKECQKRGDEV